MTKKLYYAVYRNCGGGLVDFCGSYLCKSLAEAETIAYRCHDLSPGEWFMVEEDDERNNPDSDERGFDESH